MNLIEKIKRLFSKDRPKHEPFGIKFRDGDYIGQVMTLTDNSLYHLPPPIPKYYHWDGEKWIQFDPSAGGEIYTFHYSDTV